MITILKQYCILVVRETDSLMPYHLTGMIRVNSPVFVLISSSPIGTVHPLATPSSRIMLILPRLRTRSALIRSFGDSARWRCDPVSPADVHLEMARRSRGKAGVLAPAPWHLLYLLNTEWQSCLPAGSSMPTANMDITPRGATLDSSEEDTFCTVEGVARCLLEHTARCR